MLETSHPLNQPISVLKGAGKEAQLSLSSIGVLTVGDLMEFVPARYDDMRLKNPEEAAHDEKVTIEGVIQTEPSVMYYGKKKSRLTFKMLSGSHLINVTFFNQPYLKKKAAVGDTVTVTGKWDRHRLAISGQMMETGAYSRGTDFEAVYLLRNALPLKQFRKLVNQAIDLYGDYIEETLPVRLTEQYRLMERKEAIRALHFPESHDEMKQARRRFVYEEFFYFQLKMQALRKTIREQSGGIIQKYDLARLKKLIDSLPFELTNAQKKAVNEICADMKAPYRMNRLLQGDVGSGKTAVAILALYASVTAGFQGALMVPTEILAEQHAKSLHDMLEPFGISIALLTGTVKGKRRKALLGALQAGDIDILIGTHALIQDDVIFHNLGLVITDEQHRFGVNQRRVLRSKGENPDVLFMTATPIPRTLAITVFGEMDVSIINEMPAGRKAIETYWAKEEMLGRVLDFTEKELQKGRQAYVICPLIEESEKLDFQNALDVHAQLTSHFHGKFTVGLMHGRLSGEEKETVMKSFSVNDLNILVSTTVVEVGVNVPNATVMIIYDAERFGLSQLHQLRGRVGRGSEQSYCMLIADPKSETGKERMTAMTETNDGFVLSEKDLELRGPGDFFGRKQSGLPEFKMADMVHDYRALETAREDANTLINDPAFWTNDEYRHLRSALTDSGVLAGEKLD
ncbi:ATP-dependent DNA helicase RecG [Domibacillus sp. A3M-37]|uniref:ATP-dependent DNA helicase RecG n=1 Tax=Domibacillus sp. A3M-37 TaxID=2962037 RepID=UPI0020B7FAFD|nr:ATP-dependent DNA helicase RecG [Domibacillus sp. A3M-37]MCP3761956.1 ATP-dependent DNA helicase RecG [Domibacillus sp. A3M-37]